MKLPLVFTITFSIISSIQAFGSFSFGNNKASAKAPAIPNEVIEEALSIYEKKYPSSSSGSEAVKPFWNSWGIPKRDIDGTEVMSSKPNKRIFSVEAATRKSTFVEIAKLYGTQEALQMTRDLPSILAFDDKNFKKALDEFSNIFGEEEAKAMVMRNPGLLYVKPENAATADDLTMKFSYIISFTRPVGPLLLYGTLSLLSIPVLEGITGVSRVEVFKSLGLLSFLS